MSDPGGDARDDEDDAALPTFGALESDALSCLRPGIVHRLDKGTTGEGADGRAVS